MISNTGKLYSKISDKILKTRINKEGYEVVCISLGSRNKKKAIKIHIAVACMFCDGYKEGLVVNHKDGNKLNNLYTNLEWVTYKQNSIHAENNGLNKHSKIKPIRSVNIYDSTIIEFKSIGEAICYISQKYNNYTKSEIRHKIRYALVSGKSRFQYKWEYI